MGKPPGRGRSGEQKRPADAGGGGEAGKAFGANAWGGVYLPAFFPFTFVSTGHLPLCVGTSLGQGGKPWIQICPVPAVLTLDEVSELSEDSMT